MAKPRPDLSNSVEDARKLIQFVGGLPMVDKVFIHGSRSPLRQKKVKDTSDWDFIVQSETKNLILDHPRTAHGLHADIVVCNSEVVCRFPKIVEIFPNDEHGVLQ